MACILLIETSTTVCSVALSMNGDTVFEKASFEGPSHAALLGVFVEEAIISAKSAGIQPEAVALSSGPGSYTGLRIGTSLAKGLCMGWEIPLITIPTLEILASAAIRKQKFEDNVLYGPMIDARRMEVYAAILDSNLQYVRETKAEIITPESFDTFLTQGKVCFLGDGAAKCKPFITSENAVFLDNIYPLAVDMIPLAQNAWQEKTFADVAYFEPFYLKEFMATTPKNKVLGI